MQRVRLSDLPWEQWPSPGGTCISAGQLVSEALGAVSGARPHQGGHPFDLEHTEVAPGAHACPFHSHAAQWELFIITQGTARVRFGRDTRDLGVGHVILHPPGEAHQISNPGDTPLRFLLIADNPPVDFFYYPDSQKWGISRHGFFRRTEVNYWDGEEPDAPTETRPANPLHAPEPSLTRIVHLDDVPWEQQRSPKGRYESFCRNVSLALGGVRNQDVDHGGHPFDVQYRRVPPGKTICPFHAHSAQSELFLVLSGRASVRTTAGTHELETGEVVFHPPGTAHQTSNPGPDDLLLLILTDNPPFDSFHYPDSDKHGSRALGKIYRVTEADYFDGEE